MHGTEILALRVRRRLWALAGERGAGSRIAGGATEFEGLTDGAAVAPDELDRRFPWLEDPEREPPQLSTERFAYVESTRAVALIRARRESWDTVFTFLERIRDAARPIPIACLLIPDEFQVEDGLWEEVRARGALDAADREKPQAILRAWLEEQRVPFADLLTRLRAVPVSADGKRHVYHLRDTHLNARGNRVAGVALADLIHRCGVASPR